MIRAFYREYIDESGHEVLLLEVQGHAGFAPKGNDIVCAMASILVDTLMKQLSNELPDPESGLFVEAGEGRAVVRTVVNTGDIAAEWLRAQYDFACTGFAMLAEEYPGFVSYDPELPELTEREDPEIGEAARPEKGIPTAEELLAEREKEAERWAAERVKDESCRVIHAQRFAEGGGDGGAAGDAGAAEETPAEAPQEPKLRPAEERLARRSGALKAAKAEEKVIYGKQEEGQPHPAPDGDTFSETGEGLGAPDGAEDQTEAPAESKDDTFLRMIGEGGEYAEQFGKLMQAVQERQKAAPMDPAMQTILQTLGARYGVDAANAQGIADILTGKAPVKDRAYYEKKAAEKGWSVQQVQEMEELEARNAQLQASEDAAKQRQAEELVQRRVQEIHADWRRQETELKQVYPGFDLKSEKDKNPEFAAMMAKGISLRAAYQATHFAELMEAARKNAAAATERGVVDRIAARGGRPSENGVRPGGAATVKTDVASLTRADREEIERRVMRGEKIRF